MKPPVDMKQAEAPSSPAAPTIPPIAITGTKSGVPFDVRVATQAEAEALAEDFRKQGAVGVTITEIG